MFLNAIDFVVKLNKNEVNIYEKCQTNWRTKRVSRFFLMMKFSSKSYINNDEFIHESKAEQISCINSNSNKGSLIINLELLTF